MTEAEKVDRLLRILETTGLAWVATQVREHIRTGRTTMRTEYVRTMDVSTRRVDEPEDVDQLPARDALDAARQALSVAIFDLSAMESEIYKFFRTRIQGFDGISFTTEPMDEAKPFRLGQPDPGREDHRERVKLALMKLLDTGENDSAD
jgi:hypothetical protein